MFSEKSLLRLFAFKNYPTFYPFQTLSNYHFKTIFRIGRLQLKIYIVQIFIIFIAILILRINVI